MRQRIAWIKRILQLVSYIAIAVYVTVPAKIGHVCTNHTCLENGTLPCHCL